MILLESFLRFSKGRHRENTTNFKTTQKLRKIYFHVWIYEPAVLAHSGWYTGIPQKRAGFRTRNNMAAGGDVVAKYVGHKIAKTRWSPLHQGSIATSDTFATGGWDDEVKYPKKTSLI